MTEFFAGRENKIDRLSGLITDSFRFLLRKAASSSGFEIDPGSFAMTLYDIQGQPLSRPAVGGREADLRGVHALGARQGIVPVRFAIIDTMARLDPRTERTSSIATSQRRVAGGDPLDRHGGRP